MLLEHALAGLDATHAALLDKPAAPGSGSRAASARSLGSSRAPSLGSTAWSRAGAGAAASPLKPLEI
jgi:hypothetical protein